MAVWSVKQKNWGNAGVTINAWVFLQVYFFFFSLKITQQPHTVKISALYLFFHKINLTRYLGNGKKIIEKVFIRHLPKTEETSLTTPLLSLVPQETSFNLVLGKFTGSENRTDSPQHNTRNGRKASSKCPGHPELKRPSLGVKQYFGLGANSVLVLSAVTANNRIN